MSQLGDNEEEPMRRGGHEKVNFNDTDEDDEEDSSSEDDSSSSEDDEDVSDVSDDELLFTDDDDDLDNDEAVRLYTTTDHYDEDALPHYACRYCGIHDPACVAKCVETNKWFCNAASSSNSSHLVHHLVRSRVPPGPVAPRKSAGRHRAGVLQLRQQKLLCVGIRARLVEQCGGAAVPGVRRNRARLERHGLGTGAVAPARAGPPLLAVVGQAAGRRARCWRRARYKPTK